jgi:HAD superfamily hydrolase (TIGR01509 family)
MKAIDLYKDKHGFGQFSPKAVLFDMDGVIYDSMPNHAISWHQAMNDYGLEMPLSGAYEYEGMRGVETIKLLARQQWGRELSDEEASRMYAHKSELFAACVPAQLMSGIKELMQQIKACGLKICVVTGSAQHVLLDKLTSDLTGLVSQELMITANDVRHGKPNPEPYLKGMQKCGIRPWESIVVENAPLGVRAAVAAHCFTIAVNTGPLPDAMLLEEGADMVFPRMTTLSESWSQIYAPSSSVD